MATGKSLTDRSFKKWVAAQPVKWLYRHPKGAKGIPCIRIANNGQDYYIPKGS